MRRSPFAVLLRGSLFWNALDFRNHRGKKENQRRVCGAGSTLQMQFQIGILLRGVAEDTGQTHIGGAEGLQQSIGMNDADLRLLMEIGETVVKGVQIAAVPVGKVQLPGMEVTEAPSMTANFIRHSSP